MSSHKIKKYHSKNLILDCLPKSPITIFLFYMSVNFLYPLAMSKFECVLKRCLVPQLTERQKSKVSAGDYERRWSSRMGAVTRFTAGAPIPHGAAAASRTNERTPDHLCYIESIKSTRASRS